MSCTLAAVTRQASGSPLPSTIRWCLEPGRPRSTQLLPVAEPPFSPARDWRRKPSATTRSGPPAPTRPAAADAAARTHPPAATRPSADNRSNPSRSPTPTANAARRSPCATQTRSPATPTDHQAASDPDNGSDDAPVATTAPAAPTTHPRHATEQQPSGTSNCDGRCRRLRYRKPGPFISNQPLRTSRTRVVRLRHLAVVERLVEHLVGDAVVARDLPQRPAARRGLLDDLRGAVVSDVRVESRGGRQGQLRIALALLAVRLDAADALLVEQPARGREQADRLQEVAGHQRHEHVQLEVPLHPADRDRLVVADHLRRDLRDDLRDDRVDLPRHDRRALLQLGQEDLGEARPRAGAEVAQVVRDLRQADGDDLERPGRLDEPVARGL